MEKPRVFVKSFGCSASLADGEVLAGCLVRAGYTLVDTVEAADVVIFNTCAVKGPTENRVITILKRISASKKLIVAGCLPLINLERLCKEVRFDGVLGPAVGDKIADAVERVWKGEEVIDLKGAVNAKPSLDLPRQRLNPVIGIIPISYGCLGSCAYCCVPLSRGRLRSYGISKILKKMKKDLMSGVQEFWITSQDTGSYGRDQGTNLAELLKTMCHVKGDFKIRVGMMTPNLVRGILKDLIRAFQGEKIFKFVHLPIQSADNQILRRMRRLYSVEDFKDVVNAFRTSFSEITVATDVICGFPGETKEAFDRTLRLINEIKPDIINVSKFFARPRTAAAEMQKDFVPFPEIKRRSGMAAELVRRVTFERNQRWVGWTGEVLVDEVGKLTGSWVGRNFAYKPVVLKSADSGNILGETVRVRIIEAFATYLKGEVVE